MMSCPEHRLRLANEVELIGCCMAAARGHCPPDRAPERCAATLQDLTLCATCWREYTLRILDHNEKSVLLDCSNKRCS